jgi:beta-lactam-binding protein with PASTA domain
MTFKEFFGLRTNPVLWWNIIAATFICILLIVGSWFALDYYTRHGESVQVPSVQGLTPTEAIRQMRDSGLIAIITDSMYVKEASMGTIIRQKPEAGEKVKAEHVVRLTINSRSAPTLPLPTIPIGSSVRQATARLTSVGFHLTPHQYIDGEKDEVYEVRLNGRILLRGESVPIGATLTLVVGDGLAQQLDSAIDAEFDDLFMDDHLLP